MRRGGSSKASKAKGVLYWVTLSQRKSLKLDRNKIYSFNKKKKKNKQKTHIQAGNGQIDPGHYQEKSNWTQMVKDG